MSRAQPVDPTIENRVYLFESLARAYVEQTAADLASRSPQRRARAVRGLADLAFVSCAVADSEGLSPAEVRARVASALKDPRPGTRRSLEPK
jgi:predicted nuclease of restriction endonuclease-like RecB superfamily